MSDDVIRDWRGTPIEPGQPVVYGGPVGRSIQMVEGVVDDTPFTDSDPVKVRVRIVRRSYTTGKREVVPIGPDRLTVVSGLPPCDMPTQLEAGAEDRRRTANRKTHDMPPYWLNVAPWGRNPEQDCRRCGASPQAAYDAECPGA